TNDELEGKLDKKESEYKKIVNYLNENYLVLIKDQLQGKNVGIISTTENYDYTQDISKTITDANGSVAYDIILKSGLTNKDKIKELNSALQLQLKTEKDVVNYIMSCLKEENAMDKLQQLEKLEMIKINYLSDNYLDCSQVVMASGDTNESSDKFTNIDKTIIDKLKEDGKYVIGTQKSDVKFSDLENYKKDKIPTINNSQQGTGKLSLVYALRDSVEKGNFGIGDKVDSIIPFK
ncbi:copper transporter, partial [Paraclostridium benzoelyticum]|nr:copper transporter [Paraclostridium benzoelyticum]